MSGRGSALRSQRTRISTHGLRIRKPEIESFASSRLKLAGSSADLDKKMVNRRRA